MANMKEMTKAERQAAMEAQRTKMEAGRAALKQWAADNGIPEEYIPAGFMGGGGRGGLDLAGTRQTKTARLPPVN
jgi:hypothetical protein